MANSKGNAYPLWIISNNQQVQSVDSKQTVTNQSNEGFALEIGISEDGTVWVLSTDPDPDGGGAKVFWSNGDNNWNEIATSDPGGMQICGYTGSSCLIMSGNGQLMSIDTDGSSNVIYDTGIILDFDYGNGLIWAIMAENAGDIASLHYTKTNTPLSWTKVGDDVYDLLSLSVNEAGRCFGVEGPKPVYYDTDGSTGSAGAFGDHIAISISVKNGNFVLSNDGKPEGNLLYEWTSESGGTYSSMNIRAAKICSTYYSA